MPQKELDGHTFSGKARLIKKPRKITMLLIVRIWRKQPGKFFFICSKSASGKWVEHCFAREKLGGVREFIERNLDKDLYFCPHGFNAPKRQKKYAALPNLLYSDLDEADPDDLEIEPTIAIESSPGRFVGLWETDGPADESLNRRLSYSIGADVSGWDLTQVLRIPNTNNYKYQNAPRVKILWSDGPTYKLDDLEKRIPYIKTLMGDEVNEKAANIFKRYEKKIPQWIRRELINGKPKHGQRSEVIWRLQNELIEIGMSREEAFALIWQCPWNKFKNRRDGMDQLWRELDKSLEQHFQGFKAQADDDDPLAFKPLTRSMADVSIRNIDWIVPGMFARGEVTIIEGDPGLGKSYLMQVISAHICDGKRLPPANGHDAIQGRVAYFDTENTADTVTKARLIENGCETLENYFQEEGVFSVDDEERWEIVCDMLEKLRPSIMVFDTINIYIGTADTYRASDTQQALVHFKELATRFNCPVVLLRHLTKGSKDKAIYRGQGSIAFTGLARIVLAIGQHPDEHDIRVVASVKNNIGKAIRSFTFRIDALPDTKLQKNRSKLVWGDFVDLDADDIVSVKPIKNKAKDDTAIKWLRKVLEKGPTDKNRVVAIGGGRGITEDQIDKAANSLGIIKRKRGEREIWELSTHDESETPSRRTRTVVFR